MLSPDDEPDPSARSAAEVWLDLWARSEEEPSLQAFLNANPKLPLRQLSEILLIDQQMRWRDRLGPKVDDYLDRFPIVADHAEAVVDLIFGEIRASRQLGIPISGEAMLLRFPNFSEEIAKQLELTNWIDDESLDATKRSAPLWHELSPGATFGDYELLERIAKGGMGSIFRARHRDVQRVVALKVLSPERMASEQDRQRFRNESATVAKLDHPHIMPVYEIGEVDQIPYFTTRFVTPGNLEHHAKVVTQSPETIADTALKISEAVHYAHCHGVLHRDLNPSNVLVDEKGTPYVCDFGLARIMGDGGRLTTTGDLIGTPVWMPPELVDRRESEPTITGDVYGLGAILYFLLTGQPPYFGKGLVETLSMIRQQVPPSAQTLNPAVPRDLGLICGRAMDRSPSRRYESGSALAEDLRRFLGGEPIAARPLPWWEVERRRILQHPIRSTVLAAALLVIAAAAVSTAKLLQLNARLTEMVDEAASARSDAVFLRSSAKEANDETLRLRDEAAAIRQLAQNAQEDHQRLRYAAHMRLAWQAWQEGDLRQAETLLGKAANVEGPTDYRGFEWHCLNRRVSNKSHNFALRSGQARAIALSADNCVIAIGTSNGTIVLIDAQSRSELKSVFTGLGTLSQVQISSEARQAAALSVSGEVAMIELAENAPSIERLKIDSPCTSILWLDEAQRLLTTHRDGSLRQWSPDGKENHRVQLENGAAARLAAAGNQRRIALAINEILEIRDATSFELLDSHAFDPNDSRISDVALSGDGTRCTVGRYSADLFVFDITTDVHREVLSLRLLDYPRAVALSADGQMVAACDYGGTIHVLDVGSVERNDDGRVLVRSLAHEGRGYDVEFTSDDDQVVSAGHDGLVRVWPIRDRQDMEIVAVPGVSCECNPAMMPDGTVIVAGKTGVLRVDPSSGVIENLGSDLPRRVVAVTSSGSMMVCGDKEIQQVQAHRFEDGSTRPECIWTVANQPCDQLVFSPDDQRLAVVDWNNNRVVILHSNTGREITRLPAQQCFAAAWSPDGEQLAFTVMDDVHIADTSGWDTRHVLRGHFSTATMVAWSPDGRAIASTSKDRSVFLWDATDGSQMHRLFGHRSRVWWATFSLDSKTLLTSDDSGVVNMWHVPTGELIGKLWDRPDVKLGSMGFSRHGKRLIALSCDGAMLSILASDDR